MTKDEFVQALLYAALPGEKRFSSGLRLLSFPRPEKESSDVLKNSPCYAHRIHDIAQSILPQPSGNAASYVQALLAAELTFDAVLPTASAVFSEFGKAFDRLQYETDHPELSKTTPAQRKSRNETLRKAFHSAYAHFDESLRKARDNVSVPSPPPGNDRVIAYLTEMAKDLDVFQMRFLDGSPSFSEDVEEEKAACCRAQFYYFEKCRQVVSLIINQYDEVCMRYAYVSTHAQRKETRDLIGTYLTDICSGLLGEAYQEQDSVDATFNAYVEVLCDRALFIAKLFVTSAVKETNVVCVDKGMNNPHSNRPCSHQVPKKGKKSDVPKQELEIIAQEFVSIDKSKPQHRKELNDLIKAFFARNGADWTVGRFKKYEKNIEADFHEYVEAEQIKRTLKILTNFSPAGFAYVVLTVVRALKKSRDLPSKKEQRKQQRERQTKASSS